MTTIYLAGGIEGIPVELAAGWRQELMARFIWEAVLLDPMRRQLASDGGDHQEIVQNDLRDIRDADLIVANLTLGACTGTKIEIGIAVQLGTPVIVLVNEDQANHPFYTQLTTVTTSMDQFVSEIAKRI